VPILSLLLLIARSMVYDATVQSFHALNAALARRAADSVGEVGRSGT
jgi:hypothetical protein